MVAKKYQEELEAIKENIKQSYEYFKPNYDRYNKFRNFVFNTSLTQKDLNLLEMQGKPQIEFNVQEAFLSRLRGEWSKQEPSVSVRAADGEKVDPMVIQVVEEHMRSILFDANNNSMEYDVYTDILSGGFSAIKVFTDYSHEMSFNQIIKMERCYDPTLVGFDPMARFSHKADGRYAYELFPKRRKELEEMGIDTSEISFTKSQSGFNWSYTSGIEDIALIANYYSKKSKRVKIVRLANNQVLTLDDYKKYMEMWDSNRHIEQPAKVIDERMTDVQRICRYQIIENQVIEYRETDYKYLPLIFVDGNSILLRKTENGSIEQMTRPYIYHAQGAQKLKNFAGQCLANELENMVQHKWMFPEEGLPNNPEYREGITNNQIPNVVIFKAYKDNDANQPVPPPREVQRIPAPPEVMQAFSSTDSTIQNILGSYDAALGINNNQLSGVAIVEGATQSNASAMPYVVGFMQALNQGAQIIVDLIPKYLITPQTIPLRGLDGKKRYQKVNQSQGVNLNYQSNVLEVYVEASVNFAIQKQRTLNQIIAMMQASPLFAQFMNTKGLNILLDNMDIRGIDELKKLADEFMEFVQKQQAMQANMSNPMMMKEQNKQAEIQAKSQDNEQKNALKSQELQIQQQDVVNDATQIAVRAHEAHSKELVQLKKADVERSGQLADMAMQSHDMAHRHSMEIKDQQHQHAKDKAELSHQIMMDNKPEQQPEELSNG